MSTDIKRLPADWSKDLGIEVLDPDGWREVPMAPWGLAITEQEFRRRAAMSTVREVATPAPLDPSKVTVEITDWEDFRPGDVVVQNPDADRVEGAAFLVERHRPAPEPKPEWDRTADYVATVRGVPGVRVTWSPVDDGDSNPWRTREPITDEKHSWHPESEVTDVRPLVVIDPATVDWPALQGKISQRIPGERPFAVALGIIGIVAEALGIEATS